MFNKIVDKRVRNLLRGAQSASKLRTLEDTIKNLRRETPLSDTYEVYRFLEGPLARNFPKIDAFPLVPNKFQEHSFFEDTSLAHELIAQRVRIEIHTDKLCDFFMSVSKLNTAFLTNDDVTLEKLLYEIPEKFGHSIFILKNF